MNNNLGDNDENQEDDRPTERQMDAKVYLEEYNIEETLAEMINALIHENDKHPFVFMIKYLATFLTEEEKEKFKINIPTDDFFYRHPIVYYPKFDKDNENNLLHKFFSKDYFFKAKSLITKYGKSLNDIILSSSNKSEYNKKIGFILTDSDAFIKFNELYTKTLREINSMSEEDEYSRNDFLFNEISNELNININKNIKKIILNINRNYFEGSFISLPYGEDRLTEKVDKFKDEIQKNKKYKFTVLSYKDNKEKCDNILNDLLISFTSTNDTYSNLFKDKRYILYDDKNNLYILINFNDNIQMIKKIYFTESDKDQLKEKFIHEYNNLLNYYRGIDYNFSFALDKNYGFLSSNLLLIGKGISIITEIQDQKENKDSYIKKFDKYKSEIREIENNELLIFSSPKIGEKDEAFLENYFNKIN